MSLLAALLACQTRSSLRSAWLALTEEARNELRGDPDLARHAWAVLKRTT